MAAENAVAVVPLPGAAPVFPNPHDQVTHPSAYVAWELQHRGVSGVRDALSGALPGGPLFRLASVLPCYITQFAGRLNFDIKREDFPLDYPPSMNDFVVAMIIACRRARDEKLDVLEQVDSLLTTHEDGDYGSLVNLGQCIHVPCLCSADSHTVSFQSTSLVKTQRSMPTVSRR